jgi:hypothetical protein
VVVPAVPQRRAPGGSGRAGRAGAFPQTGARVGSGGVWQKASMTSAALRVCGASAAAAFRAVPPVSRGAAGQESNSM